MHMDVRANVSHLMLDLEPFQLPLQKKIQITFLIKKYLLHNMYLDTRVYIRQPKDSTYIICEIYTYKFLVMSSN